MQLPYYRDFNEKQLLFKESKHYSGNKIDTPQMFDRWYKDFSRPYTNPKAKFEFFYRGVSEASFKLFNSAQREWLVNNIGSWKSGGNYLGFVRSLINEAKSLSVFERVLEYHQINYDNEADFPMLSILQHYGAPTPLMDWSYNLDVALYFATENVNPYAVSGEIGGYFSVYIIKKDSQSGLKNIFHYTKKEFPNLGHFNQSKYIENGKGNFVCYISDFEKNEQKAPTLKPNIPSQKTRRKQRPLTTYFNHNIIPQEGLFIFNPYPDRPLEECFTSNNQASKKIKIANETLAPFLCYNIRKDLADYVRRKINLRKVNNLYIYPDIKKFSIAVKEQVFNNKAR